MTYKAAGVDIDKANKLVANYKRFAGATRIKGVISDVGSFGALFRPDFRKLKDPLLVSSTDGVGTKLKIAFLANRHDTVGIDLVAMSVNDILCSGAKGLFFLDYIATGKIRAGVLKEVVSGISVACKEAGYALIGGETAEMPGMYAEGEYDLAGFGVGIVDKKDVIDGTGTRPGDVVIGLESSGLHSNGYSLVRKALSERELKTYSRELLKPTRLYARHVLALAKKIKIKGIANITGGAFYDKIPRIIPKGMAIEILKDSWRVPWIFDLIKKKGGVDDSQMYRAFNMGIGMILVIDRPSADRAVELLRLTGLKSHIIGRVLKGNRKVEIL
ncbi:MAG: phosphoribosylformylglycinamidine cyclo-ligase [Candidatus Omnitrophica bacterium]|nr:phosphoribosylformylglycinamidine cyclo-ligase [Candidatus Omnitrophota bacterium]MBU0881561.1 phosphoribosylformylglycinamidine cyclo-ligase [Candidatus Omnitrophota bacterium]MBU1808240.1 phosphoribosylformylglycinamidine cyclo-ligase [Candidatus Omnitrophota bacterium]